MDGCTATFTAGGFGGITLTLATTGMSLFVDGNSQLILGGTQQITMTLPIHSVGTVNGDVIFEQTATGINDVLSSATANGIVFSNGATFQLAPTVNETGDNPFGSGTSNSVVFLSGAAYYHGGTLTGPPNNTVGDPYSLTPPKSVAIFESGSLFYMYDQTNVSFSGETAGNMIMNFNTLNSVIGDNYAGTGQDSTWVILGNLTLVTTGGSNGSAMYTSASPVHIGGDLNIQSMSFSDMPPVKSSNVFEIDGSLQCLNHLYFSDQRDENLFVWGYEYPEYKFVWE